MYEDLKYWYLRDHKLFRALNSSQLKQLCMIVGFKKAKKGDIIYFSDSETPRIFLLKKGAIKIVSIDDEGNETVKDVIQKGDLFGELELENDTLSHEFAKALTDNVTICSFLLADFEKLILQYPSLSLSYTKFIGLRLRRIKNNYNNLISKDAKTRLKLFLLEWLERDGKQVDYQLVIENYLTQNDIAQIICTSRQTIATLFQELENNEIMSYTRKEIIINDLMKLREF